MEDRNNPATRLHFILSRLAAMPKTNQCLNSFAILLEASNDNILLFKRIARTVDLIKRAKEQVAASGDKNTDYYLEWVPEVERAFSCLSLSSALSGFVDRIQPVTLEKLRSCGIMLSSRLGESELVKEELAHLRQALGEMILEVKDAQIDETVRHYMLRHLSRLSEALAEYALFGADRIREEVSAVFGSMVFEHTQASGASKKFWELMLKIGNLVQTAASAVYIAQLFKLLP